MSNAVLQSISAVIRQRACDAWTLYLDKLSFERGGGSDSKASSLKRARAFYQNQQSQTHLRESLPSKRWHAALKQQHGRRYRCVTLRNESPLLLHLGRASVLENVGIYVDRTSGVPSIPGSAIKGVLSTWATWEANQNPDGSFPDPERWRLHRDAFSVDHARRIFGCDSQGGSEHAGEIVFVGAFPKTVPSLGLDIVNPHRNAQGQNVSPIPNCFLCVEPGAEWDFVFFARPGAPDAEELLSTTSRWLVEVLSGQGIGAKTASGYGRFAPLRPVGNAAAGSGETSKVAAVVNDYPNETIFKNRVLEKFAPSRLQEVEKEIPLLLKPENAEALAKLKEWLASKERKDLRKKLKEKAWFPKEWLPAQP